MKMAQALHLAFPVFPFPVGLGIKGQEGSLLSWRGRDLCVCVSVSCAECFLGPERAFWPAEERMLLQWVEGAQMTGRRISCYWFPGWRVD